MQPNPAGRWHFTRNCLEGNPQLSDAACPALDGDFELTFNDETGDRNSGDFTLVMRNVSADCGPPLVRAGKFRFDDLPALGAYVSLHLSFASPTPDTATIQLYVGCPSEAGRPALYLYEIGRHLFPDDNIRVAVQVPE